jgi:hypothetical protein
MRHFGCCQERETTARAGAGSDLCRATPEESLEITGYAEQLETPEPPLSSNNNGHQAPARQN